ncbi:unnamed protein product, partial [Vitis vinifera]
MFIKLAAKYHHQQAHFLLRRRCVYSLGSSYQFGAGLGDSHGGGFRAADDVVEVEVEVAELLFLEAHRFRRKVPGETVGFLAGAGGRDGGNGGEENSDKDEEFCHRGEETKMKKFVSTCATTPSYRYMNEEKKNSFNISFQIPLIIDIIGKKTKKRLRRVTKINNVRQTLYSTTTFHVLLLRVGVLASAYPQANQKTHNPLPPTINISHTFQKMVFQLKTLRVLSLYWPSMKTKFSTINKPTFVYNADAVSTQNTESTAVVLALHESKIQHHQEAHFLLRRRCVYSLGSSYQLGAGLGDSHGGGFRAADYVVEVEVEVAELLFLEAYRFRRKVPGETVGFPAGAGGRDGGNGGEENSEKDEEFCHRGEETKMEKVFVSTCATIPSYKCMDEDK